MQTIRYSRIHDRYGTFDDALYVAEGTTPEQIQAEQDRRFANWVSTIENPPPVPDAPTEG